MLRQLAPEIEQDLRLFFLEFFREMRLARGNIAFGEFLKELSSNS